jgi:hypothetical protein
MLLQFKKQKINVLLFPNYNTYMRGGNLNISIATLQRLITQLTNVYENVTINPPSQCRLLQQIPYALV